MGDAEGSQEFHWVASKVPRNQVCAEHYLEFLKGYQETGDRGSKFGKLVWQ